MQIETKGRLDVISDMTRLDGALVSSMNLASQLINTCKYSCIKRNDKTVKSKAKILLQEVDYLRHMIELVDNTYNVIDEAETKDPITDPLDIN